MQKRAENLAHFHVMFGDTAQINQQLERFQSVTQEDIQRVAREYFTPQGVNVLHYPVVKASQNSKE